MLRDTLNGESFVLSIVSRWDGYEELLFMQDGTPGYSTLVGLRGLTAIIAGRWIGRRGPTMTSVKP